MKAVIIDIDGVLGKSKYYGEMFNKDRFIQKVKLLKPDELIVNMMRRHGMKNIILTARHISFKPQTELWLEIHDIPYDELIFREDDYKGAVRFKQDTYESLKGKYEILFALDDEEEICRMWRKVGVLPFKIDQL